ncbi:MAG: fibronectin type III domain-containing protein [Eubacteriales bacterium]|nr:fibronectin type III domain-containing protein [Eubacteriales bacterium]
MKRRKSGLLRSLAAALLTAAVAVGSGTAVLAAAKPVETSSVRVASGTTSTAAPAAVKLKRVSYVSTGKIKVQWAKRSGATGYLLQYSTSSKFTDNGRTTTLTVKKASTTSKTISGLAKAKYYVRVVPYKLVNGQKVYKTWSKALSITPKKGLTVKQLLNRIKADSGSKAKILELTKKGVNISKYKTTYDKVMAIYRWHTKHAKEFPSCLQCNSNFNDCLYQLFGEPSTKKNLWIAAGNFRNSNGSLVIHKWSTVYLANVPYQFDPRIQRNIRASGSEYFGFTMSSSLYKKRYVFEGWWYCTNELNSSSDWWYFLI